MQLFEKLRQFIIPTSEESMTQEVTNTVLLKELADCFEDSLKKESVGTSLLFNAHYLVLMHPDTYAERLVSLPVIVKEAVKSFEKRLDEMKGGDQEISPIASSWRFQFASGVEFNDETIGVSDILVIGALTGLKDITSRENPNKSKVTMKPRKSNVYDKYDVNFNAFNRIDFRGSGDFEVKFSHLGATERASAPPKSKGSALATIEYVLEDNDTSQAYQMKVKEIVIARKEAENQGYSNYLLVDSRYVSNPHARIRFQEDSRQFQIASFSRNETRVNERVIPQSEITSPQWFDLPNRSKVLLNGLITLNFESN